MGLTVTKAKKVLNLYIEIENSTHFGVFRKNERTRYMRFALKKSCRYRTIGRTKKASQFEKLFILNR